MARSGTGPRYVWSAKVKIELSDGICLTCRYDEVTQGSRKLRVFGLQHWMRNNDVVFDAGKRTKGWLIQQATTVKPSLGEALRHGLKVDSLPTSGDIKIATLKDIIWDKNFSEKDKSEYSLGEELEKVGFPFKEIFSISEGTKKRSLFSFNYLIKKPIVIEVFIQSFARGFMPDSCKEMLTKLGPIMGLGDRYSQGYGTFKLVSFEAHQEELKI